MPIIRVHGWAFAAVALLLAAGSARAAPVVSLDLDPWLPGIQAASTVAAGSELRVDVVISGVDTPELAAFDFELAFDPAVVGFVSAVNGGFLSDPFFFDVFPDTGSVVVEAAIRSFGGGASGDGVLAELSFTALAAGASLVDLHGVVLRQPLWAIGLDPIPTDGIHDGVVSVVPEPAPALQLGFGVIVLGIACRFRKRGDLS